MTDSSNIDVQTLAILGLAIGGAFKLVGFALDMVSRSISKRNSDGNVSMSDVLSKQAEVSIRLAENHGMVVMLLRSIDDGIKRMNGSISAYFKHADVQHDDVMGEFREQEKRERQR